MVPKKEDVAVPKVVEVKVDPEVEVTQATVVIQVTAVTQVTQVIPVDLLPQEDATTMATILPTTMAAMATIKAIHQDDQDGVHHHQVHNHPDHQIKMDHHR